MSNTPTTVLLATAFIAISYPALMRALAHAVQNKRLRLAEIGALLSRRDDLPDALREVTAWTLETAYSPWVMVQFAATVPWFIVDLLRGRVPHHEIADREVVKLMDELTGNHIASVAAANPFFALVASLECAVVIFIAFPFGKSIEASHMQIDALARVGQIKHRLRAA